MYTFFTTNYVPKWVRDFCVIPTSCRRHLVQRKKRFAYLSKLRHTNRPLFFAESEGFEPPEHPHMHFSFSTAGFRQLIILFVCLTGKIVTRFWPGFDTIPTLWKSAAKLQQIFHIHKFFNVFLQKKFVF